MERGRGRGGHREDRERQKEEKCVLANCEVYIQDPTVMRSDLSAA